LKEQPSTALFRILQEALTNVARHSQANRVKVILECQDHQVSLRIDDNGVGIDEDNIMDVQSLGLLGMRERAASLGGNITIQRNHEHGTTLTAHIPIEYPNETMEFSPRSEEL
jgi:signal transduction histidine kinase